MSTNPLSKKLPFKMSFMAGATILCLFLVGCESSPNTVSAQTPESEMATPREISQGCQATGGHWDEKLQACFCSSGKAFTSGRCSSVSLSSSALRCLKKATHRPERLSCLASPYNNLNVHYELETLNDVELRNFTRHLQESPAAPLQGWNLATDATDSRLILTFTGADVVNLDAYAAADLLNEYAFQGKVIEASSDLRQIKLPGMQGHDLQGEAAWQQQCRGIVSASLTEATAIQLCEDFVHAAAAILGRTQQITDYTAITTREVSYGRRCLPYCARLSYARSLDGQHIASGMILMRELIPYRRSVRIEGQNYVLMGYLSPTGSLEGLVFANNKVAQGSDSVYQTQIEIMDGHWSPLRSETVHHGDLARLRRSLQSLRQQMPSESTFDFESAGDFEEGETHLTIIDTGLDITVPGFGTRLAIEPTSSAELSQLNILQKIMDGGRYVTFGPHGTQMASIAVRNLPGARVHLIPATSLIWSTPEQWAEKIRSTGSRVVNLSVDMATEPADCDRFFSQLFTSLPDVLFVVGAGNTGTENPGTCPANVGSRPEYQNVLTVAGYTGARLNSSSSYGSQVAKIATSFAAPCANAEGETINCSGTSVSAAIISNLAAREFIRQPDLNASALAKKFQASCRHNGLAVQCGGVVDPLSF